MKRNQKCRLWAMVMLCWLMPAGTGHGQVGDPTNPIFILHMDAGSGDLLNDGAMAGRIARAYGTKWVAGPAKFRSFALDFDGEKAYVAFTDVEGKIATENEVTFQAWLKPRAFTSELPTIVSRNVRRPSKGYHWIYIDPKAGTVNFEFSTGKECKVTRSKKVNWHFGKWHLVAITHAPDKGAVNFYVNGIPYGKEHYEGKALPVTKGVVSIGTYNCEVSKKYLWNGALDDVGLWGYAKSAEELRTATLGSGVARDALAPIE